MLSDVRYAVKLCRTSGQSEVGLWMTPDIEYVYWISANGSVDWDNHLKFRHIYVPNVSAALADGSPWPMLILSSIGSVDDLRPYGYRVIWAGKSVAVFLRPV